MEPTTGVKEYITANAEQGAPLSMPHPEANPRVAEILAMDIVAVANFDILQSLLDVLWEKKLVLDAQDALNTFDPSFKLDCTTLQGWGLPNMGYDPECKKGKSVYPVNVQLRLPTQPKPILVTEDWIALRGDVQLTAYRTDTNKTLMDFVMEDFQYNISMWTNGSSNAHIAENQNFLFTSATLVQRGQVVKSERDIWKMASVLDKYLGIAHDFAIGRQFRYMGWSTFRDAGLKIDGATKSIYFGLVPDPLYYGKY